jgi:hypothetical protein
MSDKSADESVRDLDNQMRASQTARHQLSDQALKLLECVDEYLTQIKKSRLPKIIEPLEE